MTEARDPDEWRKRLTAKLRHAPTFVVIDNVRRTLDSAALASALTADVMEDRLLGVSDTVRFPVRCVWVATGNNIRVSDEMARRMVRIRLDSGEEYPEKRAGFRHPDLLAWAHQHRGRLVAAALTLARGWLAAGRPAPTTPRLGMFEAWTEVVGGILEHAGISGLLDNVAEVRATGQDTTLAEFLHAVHDEHANRPFVAHDIVTLGREHLPLGDGDPGEQARRLAYRLRSVVDRPMGGLVLRHGQLAHGGTRRWYIEPAHARAPEGQPRTIPSIVSIPSAAPPDNTLPGGHGGHGGDRTPPAPAREAKDDDTPLATPSEEAYLDRARELLDDEGER